MKLFDINGKEVKISTKQSDYPIRHKSKSKLQGIVGEYLSHIFPSEPVLEEFTVPGSRMTIDFFLPRRMVAVEVDGEMHEAFVPFFHGDKATSNKFANQIRRDVLKDSWCENNGIELIRIKDESDIDRIHRIKK